MTNATWKFAAAALLALSLSAAAAAENAAELSGEDLEKFNSAVETAFAHREKARLFYKNKQLDKALKELETILALDFPEGAEKMEGYSVVLYAGVNAGKIHLELDKPKKAREILENSLKKAPQISEWSYEICMTLGKTYEKLGMDEKAIETFDKALKISRKLKEMKEKEQKEKEKSAD
ncbi:MAG: tetratricopeptide repeat protein [bacterium]